MGYQFDCQYCGKKIEVPEGTHGRQAKCPFCAALMVIPGTAQPLPPATPLLSSATERPGTPGTPDSSAFPERAAASESATNPGLDRLAPYRSFYGDQRLQEPRSGRSPVLTAVGMIMVVYSILGVVAVAIQVAFFFSPVGQSQLQQELERQAAGVQVPPEQLAFLVKAFLTVIAAAALAAAVLTGLGGVQILRRRGWKFAMLGAIACLMPTHCCLLLVNVPLAITAIISLTSNKQEFS